MSQRLACQSFQNGVLIRSDKTWALATDDDNLRFGSVTSCLDHHKIFKIVFIRSIVGLIESIAFSIRIQRETGRDTSREFVRPLVYYLAVMAPLGLLVDRPGADPSWPLHVGMQVLSFVIAFFFFTRALPGAIWPYHGAEHKAVHAVLAADEMKTTQEAAQEKQTA